MQKITLTTETRRCINPNTFLGYEGENNANKLIFEFTDGFIDGLAVLKVERGETKGTIDLVKVEETYELEVKSSLLAVQGDIKFQFVITEPDGTITKYDPFIMTVKDALDADGELPEEYPSWQEIIATELAKVEKATENANKVAEDLIEAQENGEFNGKNGVSPMAKVERISNGAKITVTDVNGTTTAEVYDGEGTEVEVPTKVSQLENDSKFATESFVKNEIANAQLGGDNTDIDLSGYATKDDLAKKVDKVTGKSLVDDNEIERLKNVTNYDDTEIKQDLDNISQDLVDKANKNEIPDITGKQDKLVSGTNIKTINGENILGEGNIVIQGGGSSDGGSNPTGTIISFMGMIAPNGYLICDGAELNISDYPNLANHFETQFGTKNHFGGDGSTTFAVPDMRNEFIRGYHCGGEEQISGEVGIHQNGTAHTRVLINGEKNYLIYYGNEVVSTVDGDKAVSSSTLGHRITSESYTATAPSTTAYTARPTNIAVLFCIKY